MCEDYTGYSGMPLKDDLINTVHFLLNESPDVPPHIPQPLQPGFARSRAAPEQRFRGSCRL